MKYIKMYESIKPEYDYIHDFLKSINIINQFKINSDQSVDINGNVNFNDLSIKRIPIKFNLVKGNFDCSGTGLTTLEGCPMFVHGHFFAYYNNLTDLIGGPKNVFGDYHVEGNHLTTLKGAPNLIAGDFNCSDNKLRNLKYGPKKVGENYYCHNQYEGSGKIFSYQDMKKYTKILRGQFVPISDR